MFNVTKTRQLFESYVPAGNRAGGRGRGAFVDTVRHWLGLCDKNGSNYRDRCGNRVLRESQCQAEEFSLAELASAMIGYDWQRYFDPSNPGSMAGPLRHRQMLEAQYGDDSRAILEAVGVGVDVSAFANINAWTGVVGGLIERKILEGFNNPLYIADRLMPAEPTKVAEGQKVIGASRLGDKGEERQPGEPHRRAGFGERFVTLPKTRENALACDVFKETVFFDLTGQVLENAGQVGDWLVYRKELDCVDCFIGVSSQSGGKYQFVYKGTAANTYATSRTNGYLNQLQNDLVDWTSIEAMWLLAQRQQDPETSTRVMTMYNMMLVNPARWNTGKLILGANRTERRTAIGSTQATTTTLQVQSTEAAPFAGEYELLMSPLVEQRCTDADGLNLSQANADKNWWVWQGGKPFRYMQNWPLTILQAPSNSYDMIDRGIAATYFANERGCPSVWSPWHTFRNTH